jgi:hypothetical protein
MPVTSTHISGMIGGQQAMFGNFASYAQQISPGYSGPPPAYGGAGGAGGGGSPFEPSPLSSDPMFMTAGSRTMSGIGNVGLPAAYAGLSMGGMMLPGRVGRAFGALDPFTSSARAFGSASGLTAGNAGIMSNLGGIARGGAGNLLRSGLAGGAAAAARFMPWMMAAQAAQYGMGQMMTGAQQHGQVHGFLQQQMRFQNPMSETGFGFTREQTGQITGMMRDLASRDMMTNMGELNRIMGAGVQSGMFRAVQDVKSFKRKFTQTVDALKEIAKTMNTTLEGAMPFFQGARQQGFWTPQDIMRNAQQTKATAVATGMSVAQVQQLSSQGAAMAQSVGALGATGAEGMMQTAQLVGGGLRGGAISERGLFEATGQRGPAGVASLAGTLQAATTRFARGRVGRWFLAGLGGRGFRGLDEGMIDAMQSGAYSIGDIGRMARGNIGREGAFNFVENERNLRGDLIRQGPAAQLGFVRTVMGRHLYGESSKSRYITRRLMRRYFGVGGRQADMLAKLAREAPRIMEQNMSRSASMLDQEARNRDELMMHSWEGFKRRAGRWWEERVSKPLQEMGQGISQRISDWWEDVTNKVWGRGARRYRFRGMEAGMVRALQRSNMGDTQAMTRMFGTQEERMQGLDASGLTGAGGLGEVGGFTGAMGTLGSGWGNVSTRGWGALAEGTQGTETNRRIEALRRLGVGEYGFKSEEERQKALKSGQYYSGRTVSYLEGQGGKEGVGQYTHRAMAKADVERTAQQVYAGQTGHITRRGATALGFSSVKQAKASLAEARKEMDSAEFRREAFMVSKPGESGVSQADRMIKAIENGEMGGEGLKKLLSTARTQQEKRFRLAAAQSRDMRGARGGIDLGDEVKELGLRGGKLDMYADERVITERLEANEAAVAYAMAPMAAEIDNLAAKSQFWLGNMASFARWNMRQQTGTTMSPHKIRKVMEKGGDELKEAVAMYGAGRTPEEKEANREKARGIIAKLAMDKDKFTADESEILKGMINPKSAQAAGIQVAMDEWGKNLRTRNRMISHEVISRRMNRFVTSMGENSERIMDAMDRIQVKGDRGIGTVVRELTETTDVARHQELLEELVTTAQTGDPLQMRRAAAAIKGMQGGEAIYMALRGGAEMRQAVSDLTGRRRFAGRQAGMANLMLGGFGGRVSAEQMAAMRKGGVEADEARADILNEIKDKTMRDKAATFLDAWKRGDANEMQKLSRQSVMNRVISQFGAPGKDLISQAMKTTDAGEIVGKLGSRSGMHMELTRQTALLEAINSAVGGKEDVIGNKKGGQGGKDKQAEG